jgi:hypothetical protein
MKKCFYLLSIVAAGIFAAGCTDKVEPPVAISIQLQDEAGAAFAVADVTVELTDAFGSVTLEAKTSAAGVASFSVTPGTYVASTTYVTAAGGMRLTYTGESFVTVTGASTSPFALKLHEVAVRQLVIKEVYSTGCPKDPSGNYSDDAYVILYNNSDVEADATDIVFGMLFPYNAQGNNKYYNESGSLIYENENWIPAASALWSFSSEVKIPAYSQVVVALFGAINHTAVQPASVDLSNTSYYWMSKNDQFKANKYQVVDGFPSSHYLTCKPFNTGTAWLFSNSAPSLFIGSMPKAEAEALATDTEGYDTTQGTGAVNQAVKFPQDKVLGCVEVYKASSVSDSKPRFPASLNTGYVAVTNGKGYSVYRNVDKAATEALPENEGKLVYGYAMGTADVEGSTDPSGIDAEASIANGAHIIYVQTNNSSNDFHQRKQASLKK